MVDTGNVQGLEERRRFWRCDADVWTDAPFTSTSFALGGCAPVAVIGTARAAWLIAGLRSARFMTRMERLRIHPSESSNRDTEPKSLEIDQTPNGRRD